MPTTLMKSSEASSGVFKLDLGLQVESRDVVADPEQSVLIGLYLELQESNRGKIGVIGKLTSRPTTFLQITSANNGIFWAKQADEVD